MKSTQSNEPTMLEKAITAIDVRMTEIDKNSDEYKKLVNTRTSLCEAILKDQEIELKKNEIKNKSGWRNILLNPDVIKTGLIVIGGFGQIFLVMKHEELNVITTKAFGWIMRGRV